MSERDKPDQDAHDLAMLVLQSELYRDADVRELVDNILARTFHRGKAVRG